MSSIKRAIRHCWAIQVDMLILNELLNRFSELSLFVCEIGIVFVHSFNELAHIKKLCWKAWKAILSNICI